MKTRHQITLGGTTWCQIHDGSWIGPQLQAPSLRVRFRLWLSLREQKQQ